MSTSYGIRCLTHDEDSRYLTRRDQEVVLNLLKGWEHIQALREIDMDFTVNHEMLSPDFHSGYHGAEGIWEFIGEHERCELVCVDEYNTIYQPEKGFKRR